MFCFDKLKIEVYGESHSQEIGVKLSAPISGHKLDSEALFCFLARRRASGGVWSTKRIEADAPIFLSGLDENAILSDDIHAIIKNTNVKSKDYSSISHTPRPNHADFAYCKKENTTNCPVGGGRFSARLTAPLCIAGGIAKQILKDKFGIEVLAYVSKIGSVEGRSYKTADISKAEISACHKNQISCLSSEEEMIEEIKSAHHDGDSVGGCVDVVVFGMPCGVGDNLFCGLEGKISLAVFGVPAVKAVEFGAGTDFASKKGSEVNDGFFFDGEKVITTTNNCGGILGGISSGMNITLRASLKPTPSISKTQHSVDLSTMENVEINIKGRHDSCIVPRAVAVVEATVALAILDSVI